MDCLFLNAIGGETVVDGVGDISVLERCRLREMLISDILIRYEVVSEVLLLLLFIVLGLVID